MIFHPETNRAFRQLEQSRQEVCAKDYDLWMCEKVKEKYEDIFRYMSTYHFSPDITLCFRIKSISDITPILKDFAELGYRQKRKMSQTAFSFVWVLHKPDRPTSNTVIRIEGDVPDETSTRAEGARCRRVKIGTKMVEEEIFEIVCTPPITEETTP